MARPIAYPITSLSLFTSERLHVASQFLGRGSGVKAPSCRTQPADSLPVFEMHMKAIPLTQGLATIVDDEDYDWLARWKWCAHKDGHTYYAQRGKWVDGRVVILSMHRLILDLGPDDMCDHKNRDGLDNRKENLRLCTKSQNGANRISTSRHGYKGVHLRQGKYWSAQIKVNRETVLLGSYKTCEEAALAYNKAAQQYFGEFARLNEVRI